MGTTAADKKQHCCIAPHTPATSAKNSLQVPALLLTTLNPSDRWILSILTKGYFSKRWNIRSYSSHLLDEKILRAEVWGWGAGAPLHDVSPQPEDHQHSLQMLVPALTPLPCLILLLVFMLRLSAFLLLFSRRNIKSSRLGLSTLHGVVNRDT